MTSPWTQCHKMTNLQYQAAQRSMKCGKSGIYVFSFDVIKSRHSIVLYNDFQKEKCENPHPINIQQIMKSNIKFSSVLWSLQTVR